ncbi:hypothetical protein F444_12851 [Phytophthora nicotianae P1976]|uniref:Uncharacterized protein n=1 Tax=Phytophthora nicotianae P1976 TaxID=1317066 RepID=A0A080ZVN2_PHYNI|nr:hypothetical protein F444_12851 [Phytophthora nicotianae P1976]
MKTCIDERFAEDASITPVALFGIISKKISRLTLDGPPPLLSQVQSHTKKWRKAHKRDAVQPVIDLCSHTTTTCWFLPWGMGLLHSHFVLESLAIHY